jgi:hypothetical protein
MASLWSATSFASLHTCFFRCAEVPSPDDSFGQLPWNTTVAQNRVVYFDSVIDPLDIYFVQQHTCHSLLNRH